MAQDSDLWQIPSSHLKVATNNFSEKNLIGVGGFSKVYSGRLHGTRVAVKQLDAVAGPTGFRKLFEEVSILARLRHPHIVLLIGCCAEEQSIVIEMMEGGSLQQVLDETSSQHGFEWPARFRIALEISSGLLHMHMRNILHRDLKPSNVLLDLHGTCKLADVGLAKLTETMVNTIMSNIKGTNGYVDPHQHLTGELTRQSDVYALGLIILQLLTGIAAIGDLHKHLEEACDEGSSQGGMENSLYSQLQMLMNQKGDSDLVVREFLKTRSQSRWENGIDSAVEYFWRLLDPAAGEWPKEDTRKILSLALRCVERERRLRPNLELEVVAELDKIVQATIISESPSSVYAPSGRLHLFSNSDSTSLFSGATPVFDEPSYASSGASGANGQRSCDSQAAKSTETKVAKAWARKWGTLLIQTRSNFRVTWEKRFFNLSGAHPPSLTCHKSLHTQNESPERVIALSRATKVAYKGQANLSGRPIFTFSISNGLFENLLLAAEDKDNAESWLREILASVSPQARQIQKPKVQRPNCIATFDLPVDTDEGISPSAVVVDKGGILWISYKHKLYGWKMGAFLPVVEDEDASDTILTLCIHSDQSLWTGSQLGVVRKWVWNPMARSLNSVAMGNVGEAVNAMQCSDGVLWVAHGNFVETWHHDLATQDLVCDSSFRLHRGTVEALAVGGQEKLVFSGSRDATVKAWRKDQGCVLHLPMNPSEGVVAITVGSDGTVWAALESGSIVTIKDDQIVSTITGNHKIPRHALVMADNILWSGHEDGSIGGWRDKKKVFTLVEHDECIVGLALASDGSVWSVSSDCHISGWLKDED